MQVVHVSHHANSIVAPVPVTAESHASDPIILTRVAVSASAALGAVQDQRCSTEISVAVSAQSDVLAGNTLSLVAVVPALGTVQTTSDWTAEHVGVCPLDVINKLMETLNIFSVVSTQNWFDNCYSALLLNHFLQ